jgi:hypothetical protein
MKRRDFIEKWGLSSLKLRLGSLEGEFDPRDPDRAAAWELYVELLTPSRPNTSLRKKGTSTPRSIAYLRFSPWRGRICQIGDPGAQSGDPSIYREVTPPFADRGVAAASSVTNSACSAKNCAAIRAPSATCPR